MAGFTALNGIPAQRNGPWFRGEFNAANDTTAAYPTNLVRVVSGGVTNSASVTTFVGPATSGFLYDDDGNMTRDARWDYTWDAENRCTKIQTRADLPADVPRLTLEFNYDPAGRRIRKVVKDGTGTVTSDRRYLWHGNLLISELNASLVTLRFYAWGVDVSGSVGGAAGIGGLLMINGVSADAGPLWGDYALINVAQDGSGNVVGMYDMFSRAKWREYEYDGFGRMVAERKYGGSAHLDKVPLRHATRILDPETGLQAYHYRLYSPWLGRWLSRDPIGEAGGLNLYGMVGNNPVNAVDPLGLMGSGMGYHSQELLDLGINPFTGRPLGDVDPFARGLAKGTVDLAVGTARFAADACGSVAYSTAYTFGMDDAAAMWRPSYDRTYSAVEGMLSTAWDTAGVLSYGVVYPFSPATAEEAFGDNRDRLADTFINATGGYEIGGWERAGHVVPAFALAFLAKNPGAASSEILPMSKWTLPPKRCKCPAAAENLPKYSRSEVLGRRVYKNTQDFDGGTPWFVNRDRVHPSVLRQLDEGASNRDLMNAGYAPIGRDGLPVNLHHVIGEEAGPMVELLTSKHQQWHRQLHGLIENGTSFRNNQRLNYQYTKFQERYWKLRASDF